MRALILFAIIASHVSANAELLSAYTTVAENECVVHNGSALHENPEIDFLVSECPGLGGYRVMVSGADLRYPLSLVYDKASIPLTQIMSFNYVASAKVEWLFERSLKGEVTYKAFIHRVGYQSHFEDDLKATDVQALVVTKLAKAKSCAVGVVKASTSMNEDARKMAAKADSMPCMNMDDFPY